MRRGSARIGTSSAVVALVASLVVAIASPARAAATTTIAEWQMNEASGATVMVDASGHGIDGLIGSAVITGATYDGATGYRWPFASPTLPPAKPERVIEVPHDGRLNPEEGDYAVTIRYRTIQPFGNIIQKGQGGSTGGYWKIENPKGILTCVFRGVDGSGNWLRKEVNSGTPLNDGAWHTARCERTSTGLVLTIDGVTHTTSGKTGSISNTRPISIAGKVNCDQTSISCDYFTGDIDFVRIETSDSSPPPPPPSGDIVFQDDFSSGNFSRWSDVDDLVIDDTGGGDAAPSARAQSVSQNAWAARDLGTGYSSVCVEFAVNVSAASGAVDLLRLRTAGNGDIAKIARASTGALQFRSDVSKITRNTGVNLPAGWNTLELCGTVGSAGSWDMYLNGSRIMSAWRANTGSAPIGRVQIGSSAGETLTINYDDVVVSI